MHKLLKLACLLLTGYPMFRLIRSKEWRVADCLKALLRTYLESKTSDHSKTTSSCFFASSKQLIAGIIALEICLQSAQCSRSPHGSRSSRTAELIL